MFFWSIFVSVFLSLGRRHRESQLDIFNLLLLRFNCPVLGFFLPAARVCGVVAVFLGTGGGLFTLNILKAKPNLFLYSSGRACRVRGRNKQSVPPKKSQDLLPRLGQSSGALLTPPWPSSAPRQSPPRRRVFWALVSTALPAESLAPGMCWRGNFSALRTLQM